MNIILNKLILAFFSILPISLIIGNFSTNLNILIIDLILILYCVKNNYWDWLKNKYFKLFFIFYLYLILNSSFNIFYHQSFGFDGLIRSIFFIKFILLFFSFQILLKDNFYLQKVLFFWLIIIIVTIFDVFFELYFGYNILGFTSKDSTRIVSFFYDENVVGGYLFAIGFSTITYFLIKKNSNNQLKIFCNLLLILLPIAIMVTGERSNFIKSILLFSLLFIFLKQNFLLVSKKIFFLFIVIIIGILIFNKPSLITKQLEVYERMTNINNAIKDRNDLFLPIQNIKYFSHYDAALKIFLNFPLNGVGNKNFRKECSNDKYYNRKLPLITKYRCSTHPHQIHLELLSEHGIIGYLFLLYIILSNIVINFKKNNNYHSPFIYNNNFYLLVFLVPLLPSGSIFSTFYGTLFWIIFSLSNIDLINKNS